MTRVEGKVAVVTGAASGIGRALTLRLAGRGCRLAICDVDRDGVEATAQEAGAVGADVLWAHVDVRDRPAVEDLAERTVAHHGEVHLVVNNAGVAGASDAADQPLEDIRRIIDVNLWGVIHGTQAFLPHLIASGDGHLVNVSSLFGLLAMPTQSAYNASKFAVRGYTESLAAELAVTDLPVKVSCVHPGGVATSIAENAAVGGDHDHAELNALFDKLARVSPDEAAAQIIRGIERDRARILVGADAKVLALVPRLLGGTYVRLVARVTRRAFPEMIPRR